MAYFAIIRLGQRSAFLDKPCFPMCKKFQQLFMPELKVAIGDSPTLSHCYVHILPVLNRGRH